MSLPHQNGKAIYNNIAKVRDFYWHAKLSGKNASKAKYTICYKVLDAWNSIVFIITTSQDYCNSYKKKNIFTFQKRDIKQLSKKDEKFLKNKGYVYCGKANELFSILYKDDFLDKSDTKQIRKMGYMCNKKFNTLKKMMLNNENACKNYESVYLKIEIDTNHIMDKYNL